MAEDAAQIGPWRIVGELGRGGAGVVHRASHVGTGRLAALKVLHAHRTADDAERTALRREIEVLSALAHPGIVQVLDQGVEDGVPWLAMDLVDGPSLRSHIPTGQVDTFALDVWGDSADPADSVDPSGSPTPSSGPDTAVRQALGHLVHTVAWLHGQGIVHRDIKPDNVLLVDGRAVLVDFGMASIARSRDIPVDRPGGSPGYMAPEQLRGEPVDARADLYSLGCLITELWTGQRPHPAHRQPLPDPALEACIRPLLAADPAERRLDRAGLTAFLGVPQFGPDPDRAILRPPFLGRRDAVDTLDALFEDGHGSLLVTGPAGIGKTRVLMEAYGRARHARWPVFVGRRVWRRVVARAVERPVARGQGAAISAAAEQLGVSSSLPVPPPLTGEAGRLRALDGIRVALETLAEGSATPILVVLDDLHASDPFDVDVLGWIARSQRVQPRSVVLVASWDASTPVPPAFRDSLSRHLPLGPLDDATLTRMARSVWLERRPNDAGRIAVAVREAAGNPHRCVEELRIGQTAFDAPFEARVVERLQRKLDPTTRAFVETAAAAIDVLDDAGPDTRVDAERIGRAVGMAGPQLSLALHRARREGFLDELDGQLVFAQRRVLAVTLHSLDPASRQRVHGALAAHTTGPARAVHLLGAGRRREGLDAWLQQVEDVPEGSAAHTRAVIRAWDLWDSDQDGAVPDRLALARGRIASIQQDDALARDALDIARRAIDPAVRVLALQGLVRHLPPGSDETIAALNQLGRLAAETSDGVLALQQRASALADGATSGRITLHDALEGCDAVLSEAAGLEGEGVGALVARVQSSRGGFLLRLGRPAEADRALAHAQRHGGLPPDLICALHGNRGAAAWEQGDPQGALDHTLANVRQARELGVLRSEAAALSNLALLLSGFASRAEGHRMTGAAFVRTLRFERVELLIGPAVRLVDDLLAWEDWRAARALAQACASASAAHGNRLWEREARVRVARAQALLGDLDAADRILATLPTETRDAALGLREAIEAVRSGRAIRPSSSEAAMILGVCGTTAEQRAAAGAVMRSGFEKNGMTVLHHWATRFGVAGLPDPVQLAPLPADIDALGAPLEPVLPVVARLLEGG